MTRQGDGAPLRTHLQRAAKSTKKVHPLLQMTWPPYGQALWDAFLRLRSRGESMPGLSQDIDVYQRVYGVQFSSWELDVLSDFDAITAEHRNKEI